MICQFFADWTWYLRLWPNHECLSLIDLTYLVTWNQIFEILVVYYSSYILGVVLYVGVLGFPKECLRVLASQAFLTCQLIDTNIVYAK